MVEGCEQVGEQNALEEFGVMVVGAGSVSAHYLDYFSKAGNARLIAVADPDPEARQRARTTWEPELVVSDYRDALGNADIHLVIVCTPHDLHFPVVTDALGAGKHVFCEKPIAISVEEADEMIDLASGAGKELFVMLNFRFAPWAIRIQEMVNNGRLGRVFMARSAYLGYEVARLADQNNWKGDLTRAGGGVLLDGGYHIVDLMNSWLGEAKTVQAIGGQYVVKARNKGEDNICLLVEYAGGAVGNLVVSFTACAPGCNKQPTLSLEHDLLGTEGSVNCRYNWDPIRELRQSLELLKPEDGNQNIDLENEPQLNHCEHFMDCLLGRSEPRVTARDARNASAVVQAAYESIRTGRRVDVAWRS